MLGVIHGFYYKLSIYYIVYITKHTYSTTPFYLNIFIHILIFKYLDTYSFIINHNFKYLLYYLNYLRTCDDTNLFYSSKNQPFIIK